MQRTYWIQEFIPTYNLRKSSFGCRKISEIPELVGGFDLSLNCSLEELILNLADYNFYTDFSFIAEMENIIYDENVGYKLKVYNYVTGKIQYIFIFEPSDLIETPIKEAISFASVELFMNELKEDSEDMEKINNFCNTPSDDFSKGLTTGDFQDTPIHYSKLKYDNFNEEMFDGEGLA